MKKVLAFALAAAACAAASVAFAGVPLVSFTATRTGKPAQRLVLVKWTTGAEEDTRGFNLYRVSVVKVPVRVGAPRATKPVKVNKGIILAIGSGAGATYKFTDKLPKGVAKPCYKLETVTTTGEKIPGSQIACSKK